jgi:hypothetical protein
MPHAGSSMLEPFAWFLPQAKQKMPGDQSSCLGELEGSNGSARRSIAQFRRERLDPKQAYVGIVRAARPPPLFMKNVAILGGFLFVAGPGRYGIDHRIG